MQLRMVLALVGLYEYEVSASRQLNGLLDVAGFYEFQPRGLPCLSVNENFIAGHIWYGLETRWKLPEVLICSLEEAFTQHCGEITPL